MKYIAFIVLGLVLLAAIGGIVLWANMPTAKLTVHAVRPTGTNVSWLSPEGQEQSSPIWQFAITNTGRTPVAWQAYIRFKGARREWTNSSPWYFRPLSGVLSNDTWAAIQVRVPPDPLANWAVAVKCRANQSPVEKMLHGWLAPFPKLQSLLPNSGDNFAASGWYAGTNVTTAH
jgi:hypothetical protein